MLLRGGRRRGVKRKEANGSAAGMFTSLAAKSLRRKKE